MNGRLFETIKPDGSKRLIGLYQHKGENSFTFVNLTTGNITPCFFPSPEEAVKDLDRYVKDGRLLGYRELTASELVQILIKERAKK